MPWTPTPGAQGKEAQLNAYRAARIGNLGGYLEEKTRDGFFIDPALLTECQDILGPQHGNAFIRIRLAWFIMPPMIIHK